jgi:hypothetical protein
MDRIPAKILYYGKDEPLPEHTDLRAGPLSLVFEGGGLRSIRLGDREVLRRIYVAVRDQHWGTVPAVLSNVRIEAGSDAFRVAFESSHKQGEIDFSWEGVIEGNPRGSIKFRMEGEAHSTFRRNRIGLCVLHPIRECAGNACLVEKVDGTLVRGEFPRSISPHQPFIDMRAVSHEVIPGVWAEVRFAGEVFEMEDQRNWTDASYKTYGTPLSLPFPVEIARGTTVAQSVTLSLGETVARVEAAPPNADIVFTIGETPSAPLPRIGLGLASHGQPLTRGELRRLAALNLSHLRADLDLTRADCVAELGRAAAEADSLGVPLEVALTVSDAAPLELAALGEALERIEPNIRAWLVFHVGEKSTTERWVELARKHLAGYTPAAKIGAGTNTFFAEINRGRPPVRALDLVAYSINPQVHAFDNLSLVESLEAQGWALASARELAGALPLAITVTLKPRLHLHATDPASAQSAHQLPPQVDVRQMSLFGAGWTAGSLKYLSEGGAHSVTYYETTGWLGVMERDDGSPLPGAFPAPPGAVFPLYHVLADVAAFAGGDVIPTTSSDALKVDGLAGRKEGMTRVILANLGPETRRISVRGLGERPRLRRMNATNAEFAMRDPERYRAQEELLGLTAGGVYEIELLAYEVARIDTAGAIEHTG